MDGVSVEQAITRDRIRAALGRYENKPSDSFENGTVRTVNADGSYEVLLDGDVQPRTCSAYATAGVGDRVLVCIMANGRCVAVSRLEGTSAEFAKPVTMQSALSVDGNRRYGKPSMFYASPGKAGTAGYVKICTLVHTTAYRNTGMSLVISQRGKRNSIIHVVFTNTPNATIAGLHTFSVEGPANVYGVISGSRFDVYVQKSEAWDAVALVDAWSNNDSMGDWLDTTTGFAATLPSGYITADREDYVVAQGTSGAWEYIKFNSGLAICALDYEGSASHYTAMSSFYGFYGDISYPFSFTDIPCGAYSAQVGSGIAFPAQSIRANGNGSKTTFRWMAFGNSSGTQKIQISGVFVGRWK